jgi:hypothetical protein
MNWFWVAGGLLLIAFALLAVVIAQAFVLHDRRGDVRELRADRRDLRHRNSQIEEQLALYSGWFADAVDTARNSWEGGPR